MFTFKYFWYMLVSPPHTHTNASSQFHSYRNMTFITWITSYFPPTFFFLLVLQYYNKNCFSFYDVYLERLNMPFIRLINCYRQISNLNLFTAFIVLTIHKEYIDAVHIPTPFSCILLLNNCSPPAWTPKDVIQVV